MAAHDQIPWTRYAERFGPAATQDWRHLLDLHRDDDATFAPSPSVFCLLLAAVSDSWAPATYWSRPDAREIAGTLDNGEKQETAVQ